MSCLSWVNPLLKVKAHTLAGTDQERGVARARVNTSRFEQQFKRDNARLLALQPVGGQHCRDQVGQRKVTMSSTRFPTQYSGLWAQLPNRSS